MKFGHNRSSCFRGGRFEIVDGRRDDGRTLTTEPAYTISSPGVFGSGELKSNRNLFRFKFFNRNQFH